MAFTDAMRADALTEPGKQPGGGVKQLENQAMAHKRELAHHVDQEAAAQRERQQFALVQTQDRQPLDETPQPRGPGE